MSSPPPTCTGGNGPEGHSPFSNIYRTTTVYVALSEASITKSQLERVLQASGEIRQLHMQNETIV